MQTRAFQQLLFPLGVGQLVAETLQILKTGGIFQHFAPDQPGLLFRCVRAGRNPIGGLGKIRLQPAFQRRDAQRGGQFFLRQDRVISAAFSSVNMA